MKIELNLGIFKGFYGSDLEEEVEMQVNEDLREIDKEYDDCDISYDMNELAKDLFDFAKYEYFNELDFLSNLEYGEMTSPKYYNFSNDKIYFNCDIDKKAFLTWFNKLIVNNDSDVSEMVIESIIDTHTSCSGFTSFHSNDVSDWVSDINEFDITNQDTVYKIGFVISEYIEAVNKIDNDYWDFEDDYLEKSDRAGLYSCYNIKEYQELTN